MEIVMHLKQIEVLKLASCMRLTSGGLGMLKTCSTLEHLNLNNTMVDDACLKELAALSRLKELHISGCTAVTDQGLQAMAVVHGMLHLNANSLHKCSFKWGVVEAWPQLETIRAAWTAVTDEAAQKWGALTELRHVDLNNTHITDRTVDALCDGAGQVAVLRVVGCRISKAAAVKARLVSKADREKQAEVEAKLARFEGIQIGSEADRMSSPKADDAKPLGAVDAEGNPIPIIGNPQGAGGVLPDRSGLLEDVKRDIVQRHDGALLHTAEPGSAGDVESGLEPGPGMGQIPGQPAS